MIILAKVCLIVGLAGVGLTLPALCSRMGSIEVGNTKSLAIVDTISFGLIAAGLTIIFC